MSFRMVLPASALALAFAAPAFAQDAPGATVAPAAQPAEDPWASQRASFDRARLSWINECRRRYVATYAVRRSDGGLAGLLLGGLIGGAAGYGIAGRGDRVIGTVAGAVVGAVAGNAIERSSRKRDPNAGLLDEANEYCESYFDYQTAGALQPGYAPVLAQPVIMVPAAPAPAAEPKCREEVTYEYVDVPVRTRAIPPRAKPQRDKRLPMD